MNARKLLSAAKAVEPVFIEDTFAVYLYTGNGSTQTITNGIDLAGKGGLVWTKSRTASYGHYLTDSAIGIGQYLRTETTNAQQASANRITSLNSNGYTLGDNAATNASSEPYVSWTFRKQAKFFDVVTYTGNGSNRTISHNLGSVPGCIIVKRTDTTADWQVYHRSIANTEYLVLNTTAAKATGTTRWNSTTPTATEFSLGTDTTVNANTGTYVAYLFAHDAGGFGQSGSDNVISCGSYTATGGVQQVTLGYEPQFLITKRATNAEDWKMYDNMRGWGVASSQTARLNPNLSSAEALDNYPKPNATGFENAGVNGDTYIYIAIRRGPMKTPTTGTSVFSPVARAGTGDASGVAGTVSNITAPGFPVDLVIAGPRETWKGGVWDRLRGKGIYLVTTGTGSDSTNNSTLTAFDSMTGFGVGTDSSTAINYNIYTYINYAFRRAPGFFDEVCTSEDGSFSLKAHNLGVKPELIISKRRSGTQDWYVSRPNPIGKYMVLNSTAAEANINLPATETTFAVAGANTGQTDVSYLFATCPGVSKVGSYTGTGNTLQVNCGFTGGARFVLIKRTDSAGDWYVWDSARGIVAGNDPYLLLNSTAAEVTSTDYVDTYSAGFEISSTAPAAINANGGTFVFLAIA